MARDPKALSEVYDHLSRVVRSPDRCTMDGGCRYLATLSLLKRLIGFDASAELCEKVVSRCDRQPCWAAGMAQQGADAAKPASAVRLEPKAKPAAGAIAGERQRAAVVPLPRTEKIDAVSDRHGNYVERIPLPVHGLHAGSALRRLHDYWRELRALTPCRFSDIEISSLMALDLVGRLHVVNVASHDPADFHFELVGYSIPLPYYERPKLAPVAIYADAILRDYNTVRLTEVPRVQRVRARLDDVAYHYTRLILPFYDRGSGVSRLVVAVQFELGDGTRLAQSS